MSIINKISSSIKNRKMTLEEKIDYLENLKNKGIEIKNVEKDYMSDDGIITYNVILNIKKYFEHDLITIKQIIRCENLGINFGINNEDLDQKIIFLNKAKKEKIDFTDIINNYNIYKNTTIYKYIVTLRKKYESDELNENQIIECANNLNIIITKEERKKILIDRIKKCAFKNILLTEEISEII